MPDSGVSSTTPPLAFGAWELVVGVGVGGCLELGWHVGLPNGQMKKTNMGKLDEAKRLLLGILKKAALEWGCMWGK